jgi:hypothetical protein
VPYRNTNQRRQQLATPPNDPWADLTSRLDQLVKATQTNTLIVHARSAISWAILEEPDRMEISMGDLSQEQLSDLAQAAARVVGMASALITEPSPDEHAIEGTVVKWLDPTETNPDE